jgi:ApbE superfamily uncharacterized protein (UPF0280 family)
MNSRAQVQLLPDGRRLHMNDGPIDLIVEAFGSREEITSAYRAASTRFDTILDELCEELPLLCCAADKIGAPLRGTVAQRMLRATQPYAHRTFITPMAAVAGAVAEEILQAMTKSAQLDKAYVNDGGDIALYLSQDEEFRIGMVDRPDRPSLFGGLVIQSGDRVRGIATSGWRGRSFSLGIADAVTVLADTASAADAAATIIANAVDLPGSAKVVRIPARELVPDSDLGDLLVTESVGELTKEEVENALSTGIYTAKDLLSSRLMVAAALHLQGETRIVGADDNFRRAISADDGSLAHA